MAKKKIKRNITGLRNQPKSVPSVENKDAELPISSSSETQYVSHEQTYSDEEEWCPNLQFDNCKSNLDTPDTEDDQRNIIGFRHQRKSVPSVENMDAVQPISDSSKTQYVSHEQIVLDEEEKPRWDVPDTEDDIVSEDEQDFLDSKGEQRSGVNVREYRKYGLYVAPMSSAIHAGDDLRDEEWVPRKKLRKEKKGVLNS